VRPETFKDQFLYSSSNFSNGTDTAAFHRTYCCLFEKIKDRLDTETTYRNALGNDGTNQYD